MIFALLLLVGGGGVLLAVQAMVDGEGIKAQLVDALQARTGRDVEVLGGVDVALIPPRVSIEGVRIANAPRGRAKALLDIERVDVHIDFASILSGTTAVSGVTFVSPALHLERLRDKTPNWKLSDNDAAGAMALSSVSIVNGRVTYQDLQTEEKPLFQSVQALVNLGQDMNASGQLTYNGIDLRFVGTISDYVSEASSPFVLTAFARESEFSLSGEFTRGAEPALRGKTSFKTGDLKQWMDWISGKPAVASAVAPVPFQISGDVAYQADAWDFNNLQIQERVAKGSGTISLRTKDKLQINTTLDLETIDIKALADADIIQLASIMRPVEVEEQVRRPGYQAPKAPKRRLLRSINIGFELRSKSLSYDGQSASDVLIDAELVGGTIVVNQMQASFPGKSRLNAFGIAKESTKGLAFEGRLEGNGDNLHQMVQFFQIEGVKALPKEFARFRGQANVFLNNNELRLMQSDIQVERARMQGTVLVTYGAPHKVKAAVKLLGLNLDGVMALGERVAAPMDASESQEFDVREVLYIPGQNWLKSLNADITANVVMDKFVLLDAPRELASFTLIASKNKLTLKDLKTRYNGSLLSSNLTFDVSETVPYLTIALKADQLDTEKFFGFTLQNEKGAAAKTEEVVWARSPIVLDLLDYFDASFDLDIKRLRHGKHQFKGFLFKGKLANRTLETESFTSEYLGADLDVKGKLRGGKLPSFNAVFRLSNARILNLHAFFPLIDNMDGYFSLAGSLKSSGLNSYLMMRNMVGKVSMIGKEVEVRGFNLSGIIRAVAVVRNVADIVNVVRLAFPGGSTEFNRIEGAIHVKDGFARTSGVKLTTPLATGNLLGEIDLLKWLMNLEIALKLASLEAEESPSLNLKFFGPIENPESELDTDSLEAYVADRTARRMLKQFPAN